MATRFYFPATTVADVNPAPGAWNYITEAVFRYLAKTKGSSAITVGSQIGPWTETTGQKALDRVYVSDPLSPQTIAGTIKMQLMVREYAVADNVDQINLLIKVVSGNGATLRGTLLALGNYASTAEFINNATHRNKTGADGDALSSVVCQEHDRIVVEIGYCNSTAGTTPEASAKWGESATDLPEDGTQTTDGAGWIEFSGDIAFSTVPNLDKQVSASTDDCLRRLVPSYWATTFLYMYIGDDSSTSYDFSSGARFLGITVPQGATIDTAYISARAYYLSGSIPQTFIQGQAADNASTFSTAADYDGRTRTTASIPWTPPAWVINTWYNSSEIKSVIQEIINRAGWVGGNALVLFWRDAAGWGGVQARLDAYSYDYTGNISGLKLHIEYTAGGVTVYLQGTSAGAGSASGVASRKRALTGVGSGTATAIGVAQARRGLTGEAIGLSTAVGTLQMKRGLLGASIGVATAIAVPTRRRPVAGASAGVAITVGALIRRRPLVGASNGLASALGALQMKRGLLGASDGLSSAIGSVIRRRPLSGTAAGLASGEGMLSKLAALAGASGGVSTALGALGRIRPLLGLSAGFGTALGAVKLKRGLLGASAGIATAVGNLTIIQEGKILLAGISQGLGAAVASLSRRRGLLGESTGLASTNGAMKLLRGLTGSASGASASSGILSRVRSLAGHSAGFAAASGLLSTIRETIVALRARGKTFILSAKKRAFELTGRGEP